MLYFQFSWITRTLKSLFLNGNFSDKSSADVCVNVSAVAIMELLWFIILFVLDRQRKF